jgi:hypothetical protein
MGQAHDGNEAVMCGGLQCGRSLAPLGGRGTAVAPPSTLKLHSHLSTSFLLRLTQPELVCQLALFLHRQGCRANLEGEGTVLVELRHEFHEKQAELELRLYVRLWEVVSGIRVSILE